MVTYAGREERLGFCDSEHRCGFLDQAGDVVVSPNFKQVHYFSEGLAAVLDRTTNLIGYVDKDGQYVIPPNYCYAEAFIGGYAIVANFPDCSGKSAQPRGHFLGSPINTWSFPRLETKIINRDGTEILLMTNGSIRRIDSTIFQTRTIHDESELHFIDKKIVRSFESYWTDK